MIHTIFRHNRILFIILAFVLIMPAVFGQTHREQVTIIGTMEPSLGTVKKIALSPEGPQTLMQEFDTEIFDRGIIEPSMATIQSISPLTIQSGSKRTSYSNYLKAGIGTLASPVFLFDHYSKIARQTNFRAQIAHLSSWVNIKDYAPSDWMKNKFATGVDQAFDNHSFSANVSYKRNHHRYYGFKPLPEEPKFPKDSIARNYQHLGFNTSLKSTYRSADALHHAIDIDYTRFKAFRDNDFENGLKMKLNMHKKLDILPVDGYQILSGDLYSSIYNQGDTIASENDVFVGFHSKMELNGDFYSIGVGLRAEYIHDTSGNFHLFPNIWGKLLLLDNQLEFYAGIDGSNTRQSITEITEYNPFLKPGTLSYWENNDFHFETGIKTSLVNNLDFHIGLRYDELAHKGFFITDFSSPLQNQFQFIFDNAKRLQFKSELSFKFTDQWIARATFLQQNYSLDKLSEPLHEPGISFELYLAHKWNEEWKFGAGLYHESQRMKASSFEFDQITYSKMKNIWDLYLEADYSLNDQLSLFAVLNNVLHQRYERFAAYPVQGIQLFLGMSMRF